MFIEPLHGTTFALIQLSTVNIMYDIFGKKYAATAQGSLSSINSGLGPLMFVSSAGYIMQYVSGQWLYRIVAIWLIFALILFLITTRKVKFLDHQNKNKEDVEEEQKILTPSLN